MNTILNHIQFMMRLKEMVDKDVIILSIKSDNKKKVEENIKYEKSIPTKDILKGEVDVMILCGNMIQINEVFENISLMDEKKYKVIIHIDEIHNIINYKGVIEKIDRETARGNEIIGYTATPSKIYVNISKIKIEETEKYRDNKEMYVGIKDMKHIKVEIEKGENPVEYVKRIIEEFGEEILKEGNFIFIPACNLKLTHEKVREIVMEKNNKTVVIILNCENKKICYEKKGEIKEIEIDVKNNLMEEIIRKCKEKKIDKRAKVITGYGCINVGQTIMNEEIGTFTHGIISHIEKSEDELYQLAGRMTGNTKYWCKYRKTVIYSPNETIKKIKNMEMKAFNMMEKGGKEIRKEEYDEMIF